MEPETKEGPDEETYEWGTLDRRYTLTSTTFTKRQLYPHEKVIRTDGSIVNVPRSRERLCNERDALEFIGKNTSIPVPRVLGFSDVDGVCSLTTTLVDGWTVDSLRKTLNKEKSDRECQNFRQ